MTVLRQLFGIVGQPLGHSLSPALHNWTAQKLNLPRVYMAWEKSPDELRPFIEAVRTLPVHGLSVTIPHKSSVIPFVDTASDRVLAVGAANTLYWKDGQIFAENTDVEGFLAGLSTVPASALILGAGGAARAVAHALQEVGVAWRGVSNRNADKAHVLAKGFELQVVPWEQRSLCEAELIVNTTPLGMSGDNVEDTPWPKEAWSSSRIAYDLVYNPLQTRFLKEAEHAGAEIVDGLTMFLGQAAAQHRLWTPDGPEMPMHEARMLLKRLLVQSK